MQKIAKIFACGKLNLQNFEQVIPVSPKIYIFNLKERPLLMEPGKQRYNVSLIFSKIWYLLFQSLSKPTLSVQADHHQEILYIYHTLCHTISTLLAREACRASKSVDISRGLPRVISIFSNTRLAEFWKCRYRMTGGVINVLSHFNGSQIWE